MHDASRAPREREALASLRYVLSARGKLLGHFLAEELIRPIEFFYAPPEGKTGSAPQFIYKATMKFLSISGKASNRVVRLTEML